jgi:DNA-binding MarR family transcriptional regulator
VTVPVTLIDELESKGIVERRRNAEDRRNHALLLTEKGRKVLSEIARISVEHKESFCAALSDEERIQLRDLCRRIADAEGLTPGVHPGYRSLGREKLPD